MSKLQEIQTKIELNKLQCLLSKIKVNQQLINRTFQYKQLTPSQENQRGVSFLPISPLNNPIKTSTNYSERLCQPKNFNSGSNFFIAKQINKQTQQQIEEKVKKTKCLKQWLKEYKSFPKMNQQKVVTRSVIIIAQNDIKKPKQKFKKRILKRFSLTEDRKTIDRSEKVRRKHSICGWESLDSTYS